MAKIDQVLVNGTTYEIVPEIAPLFSESKAYAVGDCVIKDGALYRFTAAHAAGAWVGTDVEEVTVGNELTGLKTDLDTSIVSNGETLEWELGSIYNGNEEDSTTVIRCGFIKIPKGTLIHKTSNNYNYRVQVYNFDKIYQKDYSQLNWTNDDFTVNMDGYLRLCIKKSTSTVITDDEIPAISSCLKVTFSGSRYLFSKIIENTDKIAEYKTQITENAAKSDNLIKSEKFSAYIDTNTDFKIETNGGVLKLIFTGALNVRYSSNSTPVSFNQATVLSMLGSNAEAYGDSGFIITLPTYASLVMRVTDNRLLIMSTHSATQIHIILMSNGYGMPNGYLLALYTRNTPAILENQIKSEKFSAYIGSQGIITAETESSGRTKLYFTKELIVRYSSNSTPVSFNQATVLSMLGSNAEAYGDSGFIITLPTYASLVMRVTDNRLLIMSTHSATQIHIILMSNGYGMPNGYLYNQVINNKLEDIAINKMFVSSYNRLGDNWKIHAKNFSDLFNNVGESEGFLFFTDCHMFHGSRWEELAHAVMSWIEQLFYASPCNFVLNGGDWLGSYDSQNTALYKLGFISGMMRKKFSTKYAMLLGNHETNYNGYKDDQYDGQTQEESGHALDGTLTQNSINATYFADFGSAYYKYKCKSFDLYCFDTGIESSGLTDEYYKNQVKWYANSLKTNDADHIVIALHIIIDNNEIMPMFDELCKCSKAFNDRTAYTFDGESYDYTSVSGRVAFAIGGHTHADMSGEHNGIPYIITKNTTDYGAYTDLPLDMVKVDWTAKKLTAYRATTGDTYTVREISILT